MGIVRTRRTPIAARADRIFATRSDGDQVWVLDAREGRLVRTVAVGRHPAGIALSGG